MPLTPAQERAVYQHQDNLIVVAGAGSGKTSVLVERYLALLDAHPDWSLNALVAITFTQKAAQGMRDRVRKYLQKQVEAAPDEAHVGKWAKRVAEMDSARIDTIHGLCASILRANAAEAGIDPAFTVIDEVEARVLLDGVLDDVFRTIPPGDPALTLFTEYGEREMRTAITALQLDNAPLGGDLFAQWADQWRGDAADHLERFLRRCEDSEFMRWSDGLPDGDKLTEIWQDYAACIEQIEKAEALDTRLRELEQLHAISLRGGSVKLWGEDAIKAARAALAEIKAAAAECLDRIGSAPNEIDQRAAALMPLWHDLAGRVRAAYAAAKRDRAALDFDDLETMTRDLLANTAVRDRLRAEFKHLLVDEFQDTNAAQWAIIRQLADPSVPGCLFVVGDPKQSIYGFRGADVSVFGTVRAEIEAVSTGAAGAAVMLDQSFRTHHALVEGFNAVFDRVLQRDPHSLAADYEVEFGAMTAFRREAPCDDAPVEFLLIDKGKNDTDTARRREARALARRIKAVVESERRLIYDKDAGCIRAIDYGDVALLFQAMTHVTLYEAALKAEGIPYLTTAGKGYFDQQEVWDLLNLLRALYNPADDLALASALRSPLFALSDDALLALRLIHGATDKPISLWRALDYAEFIPPDDAESAAFARATLHDLRRRAGRVTIAELLRAALDTTGYLAVLTGLPDGARRRGNVEKLVEIADTSGRITLGAFMQYLEDLSAHAAHEGEALLDSEGAVQLMTVHKSKGLEFPLVVLVDASYTHNGGGNELVAGGACKVYDAESEKLVAPFAHRRAAQLARARETAERRRLLYVAATRAQDALIVSGQITVKQDQISAGGWLGWLIDALDLADCVPVEAQTLAYSWGDLCVRCPPATDEDDAPDPLVFAPWTDDLPGDLPPLVDPLPLVSRRERQALTATQIADLGGALHADPTENRAFFADRWRRSVDHDAPARIERVWRAAPKKIGEIVHRAIRWELPDSDRELRARLRQYAWEEGVVGAGDDLLTTAYYLVQKVRRSDVFGWMAAARAVYREQAFVYKRGERLIHGVVDLLMQGADGHWRLVDYKTGWFGEKPTPEQYAAHARRYHLQMGVYAAAVEELTGAPPLVYIHYVRYAQTVVIDEADWRAALAQIEAAVDEVSRHD